MEEKIICSHCGEIIEDDDYGHINGNVICSDCIERYCTTCERCGALMLDSDSYGDDYTILSRSCYENHYIRCYECDTLINNDDNTYIEPCKVTLYEWLCTWLETYCKFELRMTTYVNYETYVHRHIKETIGGYKLCELNTIIIQRFYNEKSKDGRLDGRGGLSSKTLRNIHNMLHKALNQAVNLDMIPKNPTDFTILPKKEKKEMRYFTVEEQKQLQDAIKDHRLEMPILLALYTGVRQGELFGLTWENVHLDPEGQSFISIVQTVNRVKTDDDNSNFLKPNSV